MFSLILVKFGEDRIFQLNPINASIEFFTVCTKLAEMAILYSKDLTTAKKVYLQSDST